MRKGNLPEYVVASEITSFTQLVYYNQSWFTIFMEGEKDCIVEKDKKEREEGEGESQGRRDTQCWQLVDQQ